MPIPNLSPGARIHHWKVVSGWPARDGAVPVPPDQNWLPSRICCRAPGHHAAVSLGRGAQAKRGALREKISGHASILTGDQ
jgi:hypothetical protein